MGWVQAHNTAKPTGTRPRQRVRRAGAPSVSKRDASPNPTRVRAAVWRVGILRAVPNSATGEGIIQIIIIHSLPSPFSPIPNG
jgi:hypothetical protein